MTNMKLICLGYGDIASRVARRAVAAGVPVLGLCRHPERKAAVPGVALVAGDLGNEQDLRAVLGDADSRTRVLVTLTPASGAEDAYHSGYVTPCRHLQQVLSELPAEQQPQIFYVSSTGVHAQRDGEVVTEDSPTEPTGASGRALLQAEQVISSAAASGAQVTILRCSGIYGPGRTQLLDKVRRGEVRVSPVWSNRIHVEDVAGFTWFLMTHVSGNGSGHGVYLVNDNLPVLQEDVYLWLAAQLGVDASGFTYTDEVGPRGNKRCSNARLLSTGYALQYPTYRDGYAAMLSL